MTNVNVDGKCRYVSLRNDGKNDIYVHDMIIGAREWANELAGEQTNITDGPHGQTAAVRQNDEFS